MNKGTELIYPDYVFCSRRALVSYMIKSVTRFGFLASILFVFSLLQMRIAILGCDGIIQVSADTFNVITALSESYFAGYLVYLLTVVFAEWLKASRSRQVIYEMLVALNMEVSQIIINASSRAEEFSEVKLSGGTIAFAPNIVNYLSECDCKKTINTYDGIKIPFLMALNDFCRRCHGTCNQILSLYGNCLSKNERIQLTEIASSSIYGWLSFNRISNTVDKPQSASNGEYTYLINMLTAYVGCLQKALHISQSCISHLNQSSK